MSILAIETSTRRGSVALLTDGDVAATERTWEGRDGHTLQLMPAIDKLFQEVGCDPRSITAVAVSIGPGSFTGLRVGLATAKGLAIGFGVSLIAVSSLAAMARCVTHGEGLVVPMLDARQGEIFSAVFRPDGTIVVPEQVTMPADWMAILRTLDAPCACFGEGYRRYHDIFAPLHVTPREEAHQDPRAALVALCGRDLRARGICANVQTIVPNYLRRTYAETQRVSLP